MNLPTKILARFVTSLCILGSFCAQADTRDSTVAPRPTIADRAKFFNPDQSARLERIFARAREDANIVATSVAETAMLRLTPVQRADELNDEFRGQWANAFPDQPLAEEIDLTSRFGPTLSAKMQPLPLTFYFVRASGQGSQLMDIGGLEVLASELGTPENDAIRNSMNTRYNSVLRSTKDPSRAFLEAVELFLDTATARRAEIYRPDKPSNNLGYTAITLIGSGLLLCALLALGLRSLSGRGRQDIAESTLPALPLKTRLGGRHSGGMTATISWDQSSKTTPPDQDRR